LSVIAIVVDLEMAAAKAEAEWRRQKA